MNNIDLWHARLGLLSSKLLSFSKYAVLSALIIMSHFSFAAQNVLKDAQYKCSQYNHQFGITTDFYFVVTKGLLFITLDDFVVKEDSQPFTVFLGPKKETGILLSYYATGVYPSDRFKSSEKYQKAMLRRTIQVRHSYPENTVYSIAYWFMETVDGNVVDGNESYYDCVKKP